MSAKIGRPRAEFPKSNDLKVRLDDATHSKLLDYCAERGITKAEAVRRGIDKLLAEKE